MIVFHSKPLKLWRRWTSNNGRWISGCQHLGKVKTEDFETRLCMNALRK